VSSLSNGVSPGSVARIDGREALGRAFLRARSVVV